MKKVIFLLILILSINNSKAQEIETNESGTWLTLVNKFQFSEKLYVSNILQWRLVDFLTYTRMFIEEPTLNYRFSKFVTAGLGYNYTNYSFAGIRPPAVNYENRFTQHITLYSTLGKAKMSQRFMFEERYLTKNNGDKFYANRFRYRIRLDFNLVQFNNEKYLLGKVGDEIRIRFTEGVSDPTFDQNNFIALLGYPLLENSKLYIGYGRNYYNIGGYWGDNILNIMFNYDFDFSKNN
jgi:hypothetical protein